MKILFLTAGAASMYCGSCLRDNALAAELIAQGHDVILLPLYTPTLTDEPNVSARRVFFGGISVYLEQKLALFRSSPHFVDRLWDSLFALRAASKSSIATSPRMLGELTVSMLKGEEGHQRKEFAKLLDWLGTEPPPDVVNLPNSLLIGLAALLALMTSWRLALATAVLAALLLLAGAIGALRAGTFIPVVPALATLALAALAPAWRARQHARR